MKIEYRTISLYEKQAFPGLEGLSKPEFDGEGRKRGLNWIDYDRVNDRNTGEIVSVTISNAIVPGTSSVQRQPDSSNDH